MNKKTELLRDDFYEELGSSYQCLQVSILDAILEKNGVKEAQSRKKICEQFLFAMGNFHDQGWLKATGDARQMYPLLCFSEAFLNTDTPVETLGDVYAPSAYFSFHEYASGNAGLLYEDDPSARVETGLFSE